MELNLRTTRPAIARHEGSVYVEVSLVPDDPMPGGDGRLPGPGVCGGARPPVALCLVFDRSGSMGEAAGEDWDGRTARCASA